MQQVVDLQNSPAFQATGAQLLSISTDPAEVQTPDAQALGIHVPMLVDADGSVTRLYGVDEYALEGGEPSHTFVLISAEGEILWIKDYGAPDNPDRTMYVEIPELVEAIQGSLK